jgi:hypothetical protein
MLDKKKYQKPKIKEVKLTPEDAVLAQCKAPTGSANLSQPTRCKGPTCANRLQGS